MGTITAEKQAYNKTYYSKNKDRLKFEERRRQAEVASDPVRRLERNHKARVRVRVRGRKKPDPAVVRRMDLKRLYNMTPEDYDLRFLQQNGVCAICKCLRPNSCRRKYLYIDHDHATGAVRGLLCHACNIHLSSFEILKEEMESYLNSHRQQQIHGMVE